MKKAHLLKYILIVFVYSLVFGCKPKTLTDPTAYFAYLENPENGLVKETSIAGVKFKVKYLPSEYMAFTSLNRNPGSTEYSDSTIRSFDNSVTFILNMGPAKNENFDVTRVGVNSYLEFAERIENMAFRAQEWIKIKVKDKAYSPVIVRMENINALETSRNFIVVFNSEKGSKNDLRNEDMCFIYSDELFNTGTNKFIFEAEDIKEMPVFKF